MEQLNRKIAYEALILSKAFYNENTLINDDIDYSRYHSQNADWYRQLGNKYFEILGINAKTDEEVINQISNMQITQEQRIKLQNLRKEPMFKKLFAEVSLISQSEIENVLGAKLSSEGESFVSENGVQVAYKPVATLEFELNSFNEKLDSLLSNNQISREQYDKCTLRLDYIYNYYISQAKGEQVPFRKMSDSQYLNSEKMAEENGITFDEQMRKLTEELMRQLSDLQQTTIEVSNKTL